MGGLPDDRAAKDAMQGWVRMSELMCGGGRFSVLKSKLQSACHNVGRDQQSAGRGIFAGEKLISDRKWVAGKTIMM